MKHRSIVIEKIGPTKIRIRQKLKQFSDQVPVNTAEYSKWYINLTFLWYQPMDNVCIRTPISCVSIMLQVSTIYETPIRL